MSKMESKPKAKKPPPEEPKPKPKPKPILLPILDKELILSIKKWESIQEIHKERVKESSLEREKGNDMPIKNCKL